MSRSLMASLGRVSSLSLVNAALALLSSMLTARLLGPEGTGEFNFLVTAATFTLLLAGSGSGVALRLLTEGTAPSERLLAGYNTFSLLAAALSGIAVVGCAYYFSSVTPLTILAAAFMAASMTLARQVQESLQAHGLLSHSVAGVGVGHLVRLFVLAGSLLLFGVNVDVAVLAMALGNLGQVVAGLRTIHKSRRRSLSLSLARNGKEWRPLLRLGFRSQGYAVGAIFIERSARLLILPLVGPMEAGLFVAASTLAESIRTLSIAAGQVLFVHLSGSGSAAEARRLSNMVIGLQTVACLILWLIAPWAVLLVFGPEFSDAIEVFRWLLLAEWFMAVVTLEGRALLGRGDVGFLSAASLAYAAFLVAGMVFSLRTWGLAGAVGATLLGYAAWAGILTWRSRRPATT